nr:hypothetical protein CFP56_60744 [Quercus suber]
MLQLVLERRKPGRDLLPFLDLGRVRRFRDRTMDIIDCAGLQSNSQLPGFPVGQRADADQNHRPAISSRNRSEGRRIARAVLRYGPDQHCNVSEAL